MFRIVSDIHLEHWLGNRRADTKTILYSMLPHADSDPQSTLILAGDACPYPEQREDMLNELAVRFKRVVYVAGNHEHWGQRLDQWNDWAGHASMSGHTNVIIGESGHAVTFAPMDVHEPAIIAATMWAPYGRDDPVTEIALTGNADCARIKPDDKTLRCLPKHFQDLHTAEIADIKKHLIQFHEHGRQTAVVTHHVPGHFLRLPGLDANAWDDMFMSEEAASFMHEEWAPKYWFFGHTHKSWDIQHGKTRCISNPYGYPGETYRGWQQVKVV